MPQTTNNFHLNLIKQLEDLEKSLKCMICSQKCVNYVRIKVCGHYFCRDCLKDKVSQLCPYCKTHYEKLEIDYSNIAKETETLLSNLREILISIKRHQENENEIIDQTSTTINLPKNTFCYNKRTYHVNYFHELHHKINAKGETSLHIICKKKKLQDLSSHLKNNMDVNAQDFAGWSPLHEAVESKSPEIVETLLKYGALIDIPGGEYTTPLHKAALLEHESIIRLLLKYGASTDVLDYFGKKPIDCIKNQEIKKIFDERFQYVKRTEELFCIKKIIAYCYYIENDYKEKLKKSDIRIEEEYDPKNVTHFIIRKTHKPSWKILLAMLEGCTIVVQTWIDDFLKDDYFIAIPTYTYIFHEQLNKGIQKAMLNSLLKLPSLFDGIRFFICGHKTAVKINNIKVSRDSLADLIIAGGGKMLHRAPTPRTCENFMNYPYHSKTTNNARCCHYIIYEELNPPTLQYQMAEIKHRSSKWLLDCIMAFTITD